VSIRLAAVITLLACSPASALDCYSTPLRDKRHWSWRQVEGRICWYPGAPGMSKAALRWPPSSTPMRPPDLTSGSATRRAPPKESEEDQLLQESIWPPLDDSFEERFQGAR